MKRVLCRVLALCLMLSALSLFAVAAADAPEGASGGKTVTLKYLDPSEFKISDEEREFPSKGQEKEICCKTVTLNDQNKLDTIPDAPKVEGWEFVAWYTAPVKYAFWGDKTTTTAEKTEDFPEDFKTNCDGEEVKWEEKDDLSGAKLKFYWSWLSTLETKERESGKKVDTDTDLSGVETLYALYKPTKIEYKIDSNGWNCGGNGVLTAVRQYGTPLGLKKLSDWSGYEFEGWYVDGKKVGAQDGDGEVNDSDLFYAVAENGKTYEAHWKQTNGNVDWKNYTKYGCKDVTGLTVSTNESGTNAIRDTLALHAGSGISQMLFVTVSPAGSGVTDVKWMVEGDADAVEFTVMDDYVNDTRAVNGQEDSEDYHGGLRVKVKPTDKAGKATLTVTSANGKTASVTVDTSQHDFSDSATVQWGNCEKPTVVRYTCVYCGKNKTDYIYAKHTYAFRDVPATCTTPHIWEHYCKVCGHVDTDGNMTRGPALGHDFETTVTSTCTGETTTNICKRCGYTEIITDFDASFHRWAAFATVDVRATCDTQGSKSVKCLDCGTVKPDSSESIEPDASLHVWGAWTEKTVQNDSGEDETVEARTCSVCHQEEYRAIPPKDIETKSPSQISDGVTTSGSQELANETSAQEAIQKTIEDLLNGSDGGALAEDIRYASIQQKEISTRIQVTPVAAPESDADASGFRSLLGDGAAVEYLDIDILVTAGDKSIGKLTATSGQIAFRVPLAAKAGNVKVLRAHEGTVEVLESRVEGDEVFFTTDKFSTFAISTGGSADAPSTGAPGGNPGGSGSGSSGGSSGSSGGLAGLVPAPSSGSKPGDPTGGSKPAPSAGKVNIHDVFKDVRNDDWFADAVRYVYDKGMMKGVESGGFDAQGAATRGMIVTILYRLEGEPAAIGGAFADVAPGQWYAKAVAWASANGIAGGYNAAEFGPEDPITREQMALILYRYALYKGRGTAGWADLSAYNDAASVSDWAATAMHWAVSGGLIRGTGTATLSPGDGATRAEVAALLMRFCENILK